MAFWNRRRSIDTMMAPHDGPRLKPTLSWPHLLALGVGAIVGTGILTLIGVGGPGRVDQLWPRGTGLRLRGSGLCRAVDHDADGGQRLHLFLCGAG